MLDFYGNTALSLEPGTGGDGHALIYRRALLSILHRTRTGGERFKFWPKSIKLPKSPSESGL